MNALEKFQVDGFEQVSLFQHGGTGLLAIVAIHSSALGPALGGCRMREYESVDDALLDALRLAEGMTYKNSLCGIPFGGGKSVIVAGSATTADRKALFTQFGAAIKSLGGRYITAEDMGTSVSDMSTVLEVCPYVAGKRPEDGGGGDPSPHTALGVFSGIRACLEARFQSGNYVGRQVAIQGVGHVGFELARLLVEAGAKVIVSDVNVEKSLAAKSQLGVSVVSNEQIYSVPSDVFSPCAIGGTVNPETVSELSARIIAGAANNQILGPETEGLLDQIGILYAPDFAINSGGVMMCAEEFATGGYSASALEKKVLGIYGTIKAILAESQSTGSSTNEIALRIARARIAG